jgi:hypothetical protein
MISLSAASCSTKRAAGISSASKGASVSDSARSASFKGVREERAARPAASTLNMCAAATISLKGVCRLRR